MSRGEPGDRAMAAIEAQPRRIGLCADCAHLLPMSGERSVYVRCGLARTDDRFPRYPRLPVVACHGHSPRPGETEV